MTKTNSPSKKVRGSKLVRMTLPIQDFIKTEAFSGILLILFMFIALIWANSSFSNSYTELWSTRFSVGVGNFKIDKALTLWINDGLMAIFFFVVGLEIKRELLVGELSSLRKAIFPIGAALGGMLVPALIYLIFNFGGSGQQGWGIPMATDIAFVLGILALLGKRAPLELKIFITAIAIVDDIGAVLVIAFFYTEQIVLANLGLAAGIFLLLMLINMMGIRRPLPYSILGLLLWVAILKSGVHATLAGVLLAITIPARTVIDRKTLVERLRHFVDRFEEEGLNGENQFTTKKQRGLLQSIENSVELSEAPLQRLEYILHPWVAYFIMPIFALANAGVNLGSGFLTAFGEPITLGIIFGLVFGKQIGISLFAWIVTRSGLADKSNEISWRQIYGVSILAGIGFTMSLFISNLAFIEAEMLNFAKVGILIASFISAGLGWIVLSGAKARTDRTLVNSDQISQ